MAFITIAFFFFCFVLLCRLVARGIQTHTLLVDDPFPYHPYPPSYSSPLCIDTALGDLKLLEDIASNILAGLPLPESAGLKFLRNRIPTLRQRLRNLRTFIICARKLGNDMHLGTDDNNSNNRAFRLGSLLVRIEQAVCRNAQEIHPYCLSLEVGLAARVLEKIDHFEQDINSFEIQIEEWYITFTDFLQPSLSPTTADEVRGITNSVLKNLMDILSSSGFFEEVLVMESLVEKIKFLNSFIRFAILQSVECRKLQDLLNHIEAVAVNAAHISFVCQYKVYDKEWREEEMPLQTSVLLQKTKPVDPHIYGIYTQALTSSKLSRQVHAPISDTDDDPLMIMKDFIDSLVCHLWEMLQLETSPVVSIKDQLQTLHEGLRSVRTILVKQPNKFEEKINDFIQVLICDAGLIIFSLYQKDAKVDIELLDLLERIEHIRKEVEEKDPEASTSNFSRTNVLGFIDYLIEYLKDVATCKAGSNAQSCAQTIKEELVFLKSILEEIVDLQSELEELQALWNRILQVADRVECFIDVLVVGDISTSFSVLFDAIIEDISNIKTGASMIIPIKRQDIKANKFIKNSSHVSSEISASKIDEFVGFDDESTSITDRLTRGSTHLRIIAIVGMPGQGKTTLATKVYNSPAVMYHFHVRALCSISQVFDRRKVLLELLSHIVTKLPDGYYQKTEQDLAEELRRHLKGNRYLIFLDDVWDIQVWNSLAESLPDDFNGSRIILTSRLHDVAPEAVLDEKPLLLRQLTKGESWELLQSKLFTGKRCTSELYETGMQIAENCKGLPLTIVIVAGVLAIVEQGNWNEILESLRSGILSTTVQCMDTLELSYKHLPYHLKMCFLYFGMFPEDQEVSSRKLIRFWIAEGFVQKTKSTSIDLLEDVATQYLMDLISRSLVQVAQRRSIGGVKACRVHDLLHDFCRKKAKEENFFQMLRGYDELLAFNDGCNLRRLGIQSEPKHFKESRLFRPRVRSLVFSSRIEWFRNSTLDISFIIHIFKLLKVLDIGQIYFGSVFPSEIGLLVQLRYLAVKGEIEAVPSSIGNLSFLETFILDSLSKMVSFPDTLWNLRKLRHLCVGVRSYAFDGLNFAIENLENYPDLYELESCSGAIIFYRDSMEKEMNKFPNVRKLKLKLFQIWDDADDCNKIVVPDFLSRLESLRMSQYELKRENKWVRRKRVDFEFCLPTNLKKLTLSGFWLPWSKISSIGKLPNLEVLKLLCDSFSGEKIWDMEEGEFPRLRFLKLSAVGIVKWTASDDQFPHLQKLVVESCNFLKEIPSRALENASTLEMIHLSRCLHSLTSLVEQIQEEQMNMGNSDLKIFAVQEFED